MVPENLNASERPLPSLQTANFTWNYFGPVICYTSVPTGSHVPDSSDLVMDCIYGVGPRGLYCTVTS